MALPNNSNSWQEWVRTGATAIAVFFIVMWVNDTKSEMKELKEEMKSYSIQMNKYNEEFTKMKGEITLLQYRMALEEGRSGVSSKQYIDPAKTEEEYTLPKKSK